MKIEFEIPTRSLFDECIHQSMIDAQSIVTESGQSMVGEIALSEKNDTIFNIELASQVGLLYTAFADYLHFRETGDGFAFSVATPDIDNPSYVKALAIGVKDYLKFSMLRWWNLSRNNIALMTAYNARQEEARSNILHLITPKVERPYKYW